jgi:ribose transport system substrate-binding protein
MMRRLGLVMGAVLACLSLAVVAAACGGSGSSSSSSSSPESTSAGGEATGAEEVSAGGSGGGDLHLAMVIGLTANPFMQENREGAEAAAKKYGAELTYVGPPAPDPSAEQKMFNDVLSTDPDGIAVFPLQSSLWNRTISDAASQGVNMVAFNEAMPKGSALNTLVGIDDREAVEELLDELEKVEPEPEGKIVLGTCVPGIATLDFITEVQEEEIAKRWPKVEIVGPIESTTEPSKSAAAWSAAMQANRDAVAFLGNCGADGPGLTKAKKETGVKGYAMAFDLEALPGIKGGQILATVNERPWVRGYLAAGLLAEAAENGTTVPEGFVNVEPEIVNSDNVEEVIERESSPASREEAYTPYVEEFFADPEAAIEPVSRIYE